MKCRLPGIDATKAFAVEISRHLERGDFVGLRGDLGTGKTVMAREMIRALGGVADEDVASPTFNLVLVYSYPHMTIWHFDLYRITTPEETFELGLEDALAEGIALVEWPERLGPYLPEDRFDIVLQHDADGRLAEVTATGACSDRLPSMNLQPWTVG
jgi:tRNA threonylcarbamoyladenosine biosynthesis protein TsaE